MVVELTKLLSKLCEQESRDAEVAVVAGCVLATGRTLLIFQSVFFYNPEGHAEI